MASLLIKDYEILQNIPHYSYLSHYSLLELLTFNELYYASSVP